MVVIFSEILSGKDRQKPIVPPMPDFREIVELMYGRSSDGFPDTVEEIVYSEDHSKRYLIFKDRDGNYSYQFLEIQVLDEYEWSLICYRPDALPAIWVPVGLSGNSHFSCKEDAEKELMCEPIYKDSVWEPKNL